MHLLAQYTLHLQLSCIKAVLDIVFTTLILKRTVNHVLYFVSLQIWSEDAIQLERTQYIDYSFKNCTVAQLSVLSGTETLIGCTFM